MSPEARPSREALACSIKEVKQAAGLTNKSLGSQIGVSDAAVSHYINSQATPGYTQIGGLLAVIEDKIEDKEIGDLARERFVQAIVPHVIYAYEFSRHGHNHMEKGDVIKRTAKLNPNPYSHLTDPEKRKQRTRSQTRIPTAPTEEAKLIANLLNKFTSPTDLGTALGVSRQTIFSWRVGHSKPRPRSRELMAKLAQSLL